MQVSRPSFQNSGNPLRSIYAIAFHTTLLLRNAARQQGELRITSCGRWWGWNVLRRQDRFSNPYRVLSLWWTNHLDLHRGWSQRRQFLRSQIPWNMVVPPDNNFSMSSQFVTIPRSMGYFNLQHAAIALRLVTDINVRLVHTDHGAWHLGPAKPALHHANAVVDDERGTSCSAMFFRNDRKESMWAIYIPLMVICCATHNSTCTKL